MRYKVLITPAEPSINGEPNYSGVLADYDIEADSETEAGDLAFHPILSGKTLSLSQSR